ncbi:MAG: 2Fe-2S iron-sulfur cluster binding domain-containing protein [Sphingobacteriales bacterium]|nr:MAG: 2Fe-2S iron-sulfur cluster binding domain-containing protein [Sphingobacteriales bacterium]
MALKFQKVKVAKVVRETQDAITIHFENPDKSVYTYIPGQYLTLKVEVNGKNYNRAYSLCSSPACDDHLAVTVKKVSDGLVSSYLNNNLKEGAYIDILPPLGNFVAKLNPNQEKHYFLIGAGSGITPLMSILKTALIVEPKSKVTLLYGNRNDTGTIFKNALKELEGKYPDRLKVIHSCSQPEPGYSGIIGRLTRGKIKELLQPIIQEESLIKEYFICGPSSMMDEAGHALKEIHVPAQYVHQEHFSAPITHPMDDAEPTPVAAPVADDGKPKKMEVTIILEGEERVITVSPNESILEAALDNDLDPPYACMIGSCCTCKAKLLAGKVIMDDREGLTDEEIREGYVLTCQSHPTTSGVIVNYDEV